MSFRLKKYSSFILIIIFSLFINADTKPERIAIGNITWSVPYLKGSLISSRDQIQKFTGALKIMLTTALQNSKRFEVVERQDFQEINQELVMMHDSGMVEESKMVEWGKQVGADHLIFATVSQFSQVQNKKGMSRISGMSHVEIVLTIDLRVVSTKTGVIVLANSINNREDLEKGFKVGKLINRLARYRGNGELTNAASDLAQEAQALGIDGNLTNEHGLGEQVDQILRATSEQMVYSIVSAVYPIRILGIQNGFLFVNYGKGLLDNDMVFEVRRVSGEVFKLNGKVYEAPKLAIGKVRVIETYDEISKVEPVGDTNLQNFQVSDECILLKIDLDQDNGKKKRKRKGSKSR